MKIMHGTISHLNDKWFNIALLSCLVLKAIIMQFQIWSYDVIAMSIRATSSIVLILDNN